MGILPRDIEDRRLHLHARMQQKKFESYMRRGCVPQIWQELHDASQTPEHFAIYIAHVLGQKAAQEILNPQKSETVERVSFIM